ncbi:hypothetical protein [Salinicola rhizosphaerae]|uniref:Uncharacterized protein n=1 Tax=Salinicola rhizosphaerae TaxID=1443141 RepID=A0ABQ3E833_9GAMM|nr:hypothetical protein [Salinicola rhizosphaerae]GHB27953.1 hypothetical protein GCM10009038_28400 [Salinicola rhizosphaerae]
MSRWLTTNGYQCESKRLGTRSEIDLEAKHSFERRRLIIDCRGEFDRTASHDAWAELSQAFFYLIRDSEDPDDPTHVSMALPDTTDFRRRMAGMKAFCERQGITIFWINETGSIRQWQGISDEPHGAQAAV